MERGEKRQRILFVSQTARVETPYLDASTRYRCYNPAEAICDSGGIADVVSQQHLTAEMTRNYDAFVFHRPYGGDPNLVTCLDAIHRRGCPVVADYDDLIFAPEFALESSIFLNGVRDERQTRGIFNNNYLGFTQFDAFTVSTAPLRDQVLKLNPNAHVCVVRNGLSRRLVRSFSLEDEKRRRSARSCGIKAMSYLSGTASHNLDFESVADVLAEFLKGHPDFRLSIAGPLELPPTFPREQLVRIPHREYRDFFASIGTAYLNIAPLMSNNVFNGCKSGLKFFESAIWGVPSVVSPIEDFYRFENSPGLCIAKGADDWLRALNAHADADFHAASVRGLVSYCLANCMADMETNKLVDFLNGGNR